jgi:pyrrolysyl-tRNA synthetase-like protein
MDIELTSSQAQRLRELGGSSDDGTKFSTVEERDSAFSKMIDVLQADHRDRLRSMAETPHRHPLAALEDTLASTLIEKGFLEVKTPMMIPTQSLSKMGITETHPLRQQVFWIDEKKCLRPMLAPNLYFLMSHLKRNLKFPISFFEIGPCFRKESRGSNHLEEFTMLNLVEMTAPGVDPMERLKELIAEVMKTIGLEYELTVCDSEVYGSTVDVEVNGVELASGAVGPHPLDKAHGIDVPWAGVGFGLERIILMQKGEVNIKKAGRSLIYLNGVRIDI